LKFKISGEAVAEETVRRAERIEKERKWKFSLLGKTGFKVSKAGFGCYRINSKHRDHCRALSMALKEGINLIDTSTNYSFGESEKLVGQVLEDMMAQGLVKREEIVVVSKIGYVQGPAMEVALEREKEGKPFPEMVYYDDNCWHCIVPEFLEDQLNRSLERLNMEKLDVLLLHNPEYYLSLARKKGEDWEKSIRTYYSRIEKAFRYLEEEVKNKRISWYGISSNTFPSPCENFEHTSLEKVWSIAENISPDNHFAVIQLPANLYEDGALFNKNQKKAGLSVLEFAKEKNLGVLINRPLNSYPGNRLVRLSDFPLKEKTCEGDVKKNFEKLIALEEEISKNLKGVPAGQLMPGKMLEEEWKFISGIDHWNMIKYNYIIPQTGSMINVLRNNISGKDTDCYVEELSRAMDSITDYYHTKSQEESDGIHKKLNKFLPDMVKECTLSQKAVWMLSSLPGVNTVLVGMRQENYVQDIIEMLNIPLSSGGEKLWDKWKGVV